MRAAVIIHREKTENVHGSTVKYDVYFIDSAVLSYLVNMFLPIEFTNSNILVFLSVQYDTT